MVVAHGHDFRDEFGSHLHLVVPFLMLGALGGVLADETTRVGVVVSHRNTPRGVVAEGAATLGHAHMGGLGVGGNAHATRLRVVMTNTNLPTIILSV